MSQGKSAIAREVLVTGYSEGAFAAVAVMDALSNIAESGNDDEPWRIQQAVVGGGPFRTNLQFLEGFKAFTTPGLLDPELRFITALLAIPFSSSTTDVVNFGQQQDMIDTVERERILLGFQSATNDNDVNALISPEDPFGFYDPVFIDLVEQALAANVTDPCNSDLVIPGESDLLCQAIVDQNLVEVLEKIRIPTTIFHSNDDDLIPIVNLPNVEANPFLSFFPLPGDHVTAGGVFGAVLLQQLFLVDNPATLSPTLSPATSAPSVNIEPSPPDANYKVSVICSGGKIMSESSDSPISVCRIGKCSAVNKKAVLSNFGSKFGFDQAAMIALRCDDKAVGGLCIRDGNGFPTFTDKCPKGEDAVMTLTRDGHPSRRLLRGGLAKENQDMTPELVETDGDILTVYTLV